MVHDLFRGQRLLMFVFCIVLFTSNSSNAEISLYNGRRALSALAVSIADRRRGELHEARIVL